MNKRIKKILKRTLLSLTVLIVVAMVSLFFILKFKLNETISFLVDRESNSCYAIEIGYSDYSYWKDQIVLKRIKLINKNCSDKSIKELAIKNVVLDVKGIYPMLLGHDYQINKLLVQGLRFDILMKKKGKKITFKEELNKIRKGLSKIGGNFHMENIHLQDANIRFVHANTKMYLNHIDMRINRFRKLDDSNHFDAQFNISLPQQHLAFNANVIEFDSLVINDQHGLSINNFILKQPVPDHPADYNIVQGEKLRFLMEPAFFNNDDFIVDSLFFSKVRVSNHLIHQDIEGNISNVEKQFKPESIFQLFSTILVKSIKLNDLQVTFPTNSKRAKAITINQHALLISHLLLNDSTGVSCEKLKLIDDQLDIKSPDGAQEIQFSEFGFHNNTINLLHPSIVNLRSGEKVDAVRLAQIKLVDLDISKALNLDFHAQSVQFIKPEINLTLPERSKKDTFALNFESLNKLVTTNVGKAARFFQCKKIEIFNGEVRLKNKTSLLEISRLNAVFNSENLDTCSHIFFYPDKFSKLTVGSLHFKDKKHKLDLKDAHFYFLENSYHFGSVNLESPTIAAEISNLNLIELDILGYIRTNKLNLDIFQVDQLQLRLNTHAHTDAGNFKLPEIRVDSVQIHETSFTLYKESIKQTAFTILKTDLNKLYIDSKTIGYEHADAWIDAIYVLNEDQNLDFELDNLHLHDKVFELKDFVIRSNKKNQFNLSIPKIELVFAETNFNKEALKIEKLVFPKSNIEMVFKEFKTKQSKANSTNTEKHIKLPQLEIGEILLEELGIHTSIKAGDYSINGKFHLDMSLHDIQQQSTTLTGSIRQDIRQLPLSLQLNMNLTGNISQFNYKQINGSIRKIAVENSRKIDQKTIQSILEDPILIADFLHGTFTGIEVKHNKVEVQCSDLTWKNLDKQLTISNISMKPRVTRNEHFNKHLFESVFLNTSEGNVNFKNVSVREIIKEKKYIFPNIEMENFVINVSKDKSKPLEPGKIKPMFTDLLQGIDQSVQIGELHFKNITLPYQERHSEADDYIAMNFSKMTGVITNIVSDPLPTDSLTIDASLMFNDMHIKRFFYRESYLDTLSAFRMHIFMSRADLTQMTSISQPLINVEIKSGICDSLSAHIQGNKLAAYGSMRFVYNNLSVQLDSNERIKSRFLLYLINSTANNYLLHRRNNRTTYVFTVRDDQRMVINLWIKSLISGLFTSTGIKSNRKYNRIIKENKSKYYL